MEVNEYQIGGDHYNKRDYQHWDFVCDTNLHYLLGCATKYSRWRDKNGVQDLRKVAHYISKAEERDIWPPGLETIETEVMRFADQFEHKDDRELIALICAGEYEAVQKHICEMIDEVECGPTANYVDPDNNYFRG